AWVDAVYLLRASEADVPRLRKCALFDAVLTLGFRQSTLRSYAVAALGELPLASRLRELDLSGCEIGNVGAEALMDGSFASLRSLDLACCQLTGDAIGRLCGSKTSLADLRSLILWGNPLGDGGLCRLARSRGWPGLRRLNLSRCQASDQGWRELAGWP